MTPSINENAGELFQLLASLPSLILDAERALDDGIFANDLIARAQAELLIADARRFYDELLREACAHDTGFCPEM